MAGKDIEWRRENALIPYPIAVAAMEERVASILAGTASPLVWLLEHPPLYTAGTSARDHDLLDAAGLPVYESGRGGQYTYHGPGQRIGYVMVDLNERGRDLRRFVHDLEEWIIRALATLDVIGERRPGRVGVWVPRPHGEDKIAAIGIRVRRWISYHGISLNRAPDLRHFAGIVPCGIRGEGYGVTSLAALGIDISTAELDSVLEKAFSTIFG
ncbi:MAG TPA: lipoyl(octanoyl) transferase LipB [Dongiaceae bacterium]|jgi:lipoyl(octanoyl) transferase|nr:lipoyl(octanoyl) transferase LipB [Dongiaceae bacterium]